MSEITREEWEPRYAARIQQCAGWTAEESAEAARVGAIEHERNERAAGNAVVWWSGPTGAQGYSPEDEADEEMSYWTNDEE